MSVAIDFTASNKEPDDPESLHYCKQDDNGKDNQYETAIQSVGKILESYAYKKRFNGFGFGGIPPNSIEGVSHCFELNGNSEQPAVEGLQKLIEVYKDNLQKVKLWGPTMFHKILDRVMTMIKKNNQSNQVQMYYYILLILTDGCVHDMRQTIDLIVECSSLPLSIIIVGIGGDKDSEFKNMEILDSDDA